jgi:hypothetical protein
MNILQPPILTRHVREIGDSKWIGGAWLLQANPNQRECWIAENCTGYRYILERGTQPNEYIQKTYWNESLVKSIPMTVEPSPIIQENKETTPNLLNAEEAQLEYQTLVVYMSKKIEK